MKKLITSIAAAAIGVSLLAVSASADFITETSSSKSIALADAYDNGEAWLHMINPYNDSAMYALGDIAADTKDVIICFDVTGCDGSYTAMAGFGINGWSPSVWSEEEYTNLIGGMPEYVIGHDGSYEMIVPFNLFMAAAPVIDEDTGEEIYKEYIELLDCLELCIYGIAENTSTVITITDIKQSSDAHTFEECELKASANNEVAQTESSAAPVSEAQTGNTVPSSTDDKNSPDTGVTDIAAIGGAAAISALAVVLFRKKL